MLNRDEDTGRFLPEKPLLDQLKEFREFLESTRSTSTAQTYLMGARKIEDHLNGRGMTLETAPPGLLDNFVVWLKAKHLTPASIRSNVVGAKRYIKWSRSQGQQIAEFEDPDLPKIPEKAPFVLSSDELAVFFNKAQLVDEPARTALLLLPLCGLRVSEICALNLSDILSSKDDKGKKWTVFEVTGKGSKLRFAPLPRSGKTILKIYLNGWRAKKKSKSNYLFPGKGKKPILSVKTLQAYVREIRLNSSLPDKLTPHALRRTYLTKLQKKGVDLLHISKIAGHSNIQTTFKYYLATDITDTLNEMNKAFK